MSKDTDNNYINTLDPVLREALRTIDLQPEKEVERYERFKNIMANMATRDNNPQIVVPENPESQLQIKTEAITKKHSSSPVKLPNFGNKVANVAEANSLKQQIISLVHQPVQEPTSSEPDSEESAAADYFQSSENLLQSLKEEEKPRANSSESFKSLKGVQEKLLTPFGIGSFLMLLCTGGLLLGYLGWNNLLNAESAFNPENIKEDHKSSEDSQDKTEIAAPVSLDLETISSLKPNSNPFISNPVANPTNSPSQSVDKPTQSVEVTRSGADLASALLPASLRSDTAQTAVSNPNTSQNNNVQVGQIPVSSSVINRNTSNIAPIPVPAPPPPKTEKKNNPSANKQSINQVKFFGDYYYVLVPSNNPNTLAQVRKIVKDAYLVQFPQGVRIQMGAFDNQKDAQELLGRLKQQGITGEIYHPK